jgi:transmembrane protein TMEM260 (protein O-mannosyltransferase)
VPLIALAVSGAVLLGYFLTLAPTVTFWDAGELIAAAKTLGIPHPPGTPLFVMIAHVWALAVPVGEYAYRTNLLSALLSAAGAGCFFLALQESLAGRLDSATARIGGAAAGAVIGAFTFTAWQNSNETEVYAVATFTIGLMTWLAFRWRRARGTPLAARILLLIVYLAGVSIGNHLLALLAGPAVIMFLTLTLRETPAADPAERRCEWGQVAVVAGIWALLVGIGLGSTALVGVGAAAFLAAAGFAASRGSGGFALISLGLAGVGLTPYLFLYLRSAQHPMINEAAPSTVDALLAVIRRAQYPPRTPLDDPTVASGPMNPGRTPRLLGLQLLDYVVYFDWQWARSAAGTVAGFPLRTGATVLFAWLGLRGLAVHRRLDRSGWWMLVTLFLVTGLGLVGYMNFRPGFSRWYDLYPTAANHEVRERDYFFVVSFVVWGLWAGIGIADLVRRAARARCETLRRVAPALFLLAVIPMALNWRAATRRGADARLAADFAYDLLNSAPPYGILFTYGDNDTFPLWWAQEVAGIRRDVTVICIALANTDWYMRQLRDNPARPVDAESLPAVWRGPAVTLPDWPLHTMTDSLIASAMRGYAVRGSRQLAIGPITRTLTDGSLLYPSDILTLSVVQQNLGRRPVVWASTTGKSYGGFADYAVQRGMGIEVVPSRPDTTSPLLDLHRLAGVPLDLPTTERLVWETYRYGGLMELGEDPMESTNAMVAASLATPFVQLVYAYAGRDRPKMEKAIDAAARLSPNPEIRTALRSLRPPGGDSTASR